MISTARLAFAAALVAISARPVVRFAMWMQTLPIDGDVGAIPYLPVEDLWSIVDGKEVLVVGGTRGVGYGTARAMAAAGAHVTLVGRSDASGSKAVSKIKSTPGVQRSTTVEYVRGDIGTVCSALSLVNLLESRPTKRYDYAVVSAATFPDWTKPLKNEDGLDKSFAIAVVGRFLLYKHMHRFMKEDARILNVLASGSKLPTFMFDEDVATGKKTVTSLIPAMMNFAIGNEIMMEALFAHDEHYSTNGQFTMVSTHPGMLATDLHLGQGWLFDIVEWVMVKIVGITEEEAGMRQSSILVSDKLHRRGLTLVDNFGYGRVRDAESASLVEQKRDWMWSFLTKLESNRSCDDG